MASGIDWFRWHHGSITDPKFQLVAKKANVRFGDVIALWAFILEMASADSDRGNIGQIDFETLDYMLGADEGTAIRILDAMTTRGLIVGNRVASWEKRQPKRERENDNSTERSKAFREKQRHATPCDANETQETPREEKRREDISTTDVVDKKRATRFDAHAHLVSIGVDASVASDWLTSRKSLKAAPTQTAIEGIASEADRAGISLSAALAMCCQRGWRGFKAEWVKEQSPQQPRPIINQRDSDREAVSFGLTGRQQTPQLTERDITGESSRVA